MSKCKSGNACCQQGSCCEREALLLLLLRHAGEDPLRKACTSCVTSIVL
jgi:hypothetical protein